MTGTTGERLDGRFARLWAASTMSALGSGMATVAAPLFVAARTDDPLTVSVASAVAWLPWLLFALPGGVLVDRVDRRRLMVVIDWVRVVALAVLTAAIVNGRAGVALLYAVLFVVNAGEVVFRAAGQAMLPTLVPRSLLERANGWLGGGTTLTQGMIAGPLGGFLFVLAASIPFGVNAATYALSAVLIGLVAGSYRAGSGPEPGGRRSVRAEVVEGFRWLMSQRLLRTMTLLIGLLNVTLTAAIAVLVLLATQRLGLGSVGYGVLFTCMAVGGLLGSVVGDRLVARITATWTIRIGLLIEAGLHLALAASRSAVVIAVALFAFGVHGALWNMVSNSLRQRLTPAVLQGRVGSTTLFIAAGGNCLGALLGGVVAARFGLTAPYWVGFVVAVAVTAVTWRVFARSTVAAAYAVPAPTPDDRPATVA
ncbi:putative MFS family arabinose efflux permease [Micromonospora kangleipakensis]|uniref:Putative MFS family arabinose efflux permease n=1 Tax=Micromonospora kangleipakensis TaxID=1077942 RepID=A0A4Q8BCS8_9ACTN|nr:MFS transporter [Micromonospora kangleipakensis]RZU75677.1 putative MFS family arabinose efflux permease [Micromonospora kangleipakensis]